MIERAVILAGGRGTRLKPFTFAFPKPLMPIGETPILEIIVRQLEAAGVRRVTMAVGHLAELIAAYFASQPRNGLQIDYSREPAPLGTAGPIALIDDLDAPFFVMNGDILTTLDYRDLAAFHARSGAIATIASYRKAQPIDLGVLEVGSDGRLLRYVEKPNHEFLVSMGIYAFQPEVRHYIEQGTRLDLPDLINRLLAARAPLAVYAFDGRWLDIGHADDYARALEEFERQRDLFLPTPTPVSSRSPRSA